MNTYKHLKFFFLLPLMLLFCVPLYSNGCYDDDKTILPFNDQNYCIKLIVYFDIDNTANSYFNNIIYFVNKLADKIPDSDLSLNIVIAEGIFENSESKKSFLSKFKFERPWNVKLIESDSILDSYNDVKGLAKYRFIKDNLTIDSGTCKWDFPDSLNTLLNCGSEKLEISVKLKDRVDIRKKVTTTNNVLKVIDSCNVLIINDYNNKVFLLSYSKGQLKYKEFNWVNNLNPQKIFCSSFAKDKMECEYAIKNKLSIDVPAKNEMYFTNASSTDSFIYVGMNFYANKIIERDEYFINDLGVMDTLFKGNMIATQYSVIVKFDKMLNFITYFPVSDEGIFSDKNEKLLAGVDFGFEISEKTNDLICFLSLYNTVFSDSNLHYSFGKFELNSQNIYEFKSFCNVPYPEDFSKKWFASSFVNPKMINGKIAAAFGACDWFYLDTMKIYIDQQRDKHLLPKENLITYLGQNEVLKYNYHILGISNDIKGKYIIVFYKLEDDFYLEILDKNYQSVHILNLRHTTDFPLKLSFDDLDEGAFDLSYNILTLNYRDKSAIYLMRFEIVID